MPMRSAFPFGRTETMTSPPPEPLRGTDGLVPGPWHAIRPDPFLSGVDTGWTDGSDRCCDVVRSEAAGQDNRNTGEICDAATDAPVVRYAERADLFV